MKSLTELNDKGEGRGINNNNNKKQNLDQRQVKLQAQIKGPYAESRSAKRPRGTLATPPSVEEHTKKA